MEENTIKKAQQALCEHLLRLKSIGDCITLKPADELLITVAMVKTFDAILEKERFNQDYGINPNLRR